MAKESKISKNDTGLRWLTVMSLVMLGVIYYLPMFFMEGIVPSDDTTFHLGRLVGLSNVWTSPVNFDSFGRNGLMVNIFYPWLTMYPMWLLYRITGSYVLGYKLYYTLLTVATLFISYLSMKGIAKSRTGAYIFAVLYTFSSYRYADIFNRGSLGEAVALTFLPLVLLGIYRVCCEDYRKWLALTAGMTLIAYSHILTLLMSAAFVGIMYLVTLAFQSGRKERFLSLTKAAGLSVCLSAAMMIPMAEQYLRNELFTPGGSGDKMAGSAYSLAEIIRFTLVNNPEGRGVGILAGAAFIASCALLAGRLFSGRRRGRKEPEVGFSAALMLVGMVLFVCTSDMLPWHYLGESTPVSTLQFAWRLNAYPVLGFTAAFAVLASKAVSDSPKLTKTLVAAVVIAAVGIQCCSLYTRAGIYADKEPIHEADIAGWPSGNVDYGPLKAWEYKEANGKSMEYIYIDGKETEKSPETRDSGTVYVQSVNTDKDSAKADIPVFRYYGQDVRLNGEPASAEMSERGTVLVDIPGSGRSVIMISYKYTAAARAAWIFSIIVLAITAVRIIQYRRNTHLDF